MARHGSTFGRRLCNDDDDVETCKLARTSTIITNNRNQIKKITKFIIHSGRVHGGTFSFNRDTRVAEWCTLYSTEDHKKNHQRGFRFAFRLVSSSSLTKGTRIPSVCSKETHTSVALPLRKLEARINRDRNVRSVEPALTE